MKVYKRALFALAILATGSMSAPAAATIGKALPSDTRVGVELGAPATLSTILFVNALQQAGPWTSSAPLDVDPSGDVRFLPSGRVAERRLDATLPYPNGDYTLLYAGTGRLEVDGATIVRRMPQRYVVRVAGGYRGLRVRLVSSDPRDYVRDVRLILPGYETTYERSPFLPSTIAALQRVNAIRFAGLATSTRAASTGMVPRYATRLANATGDDPWFVIPADLNDRDVFTFAQLVRATLDVRLRPIFETAPLPVAGALANAARARHVLDIVSQAFAGDARAITRVFAMPAAVIDSPAPQVRALVMQSLAIARADALDTDLTAVSQTTSNFAVVRSMTNAVAVARAAHVASFASGLSTTRGSAPFEHWHAAGGALGVASPDEPARVADAVGAYARRYPAPHAVPSVVTALPQPQLPSVQTSRWTRRRPGDAVVDVVAIDAGGTGADPYVTDEDFGAGSFSSTTKNAIDTSAVTNSAPPSVYQSIRAGGTFAYTIAGLTANAPYGLRLHFSENFWNQSGKRVFNVSVNGASVLAKFDIFATAGKRYAAVARAFNVTANATGQLIIKFTAVADNASIAGIEVQPSAVSTPALNDWTTYGYDNARDGFNPNSAAFTPASVTTLSRMWQTNLATNTQTQPVVATNVAGHAALLVVAGANGSTYAYDSSSGSQVWKTALGSQSYVCDGSPSQFGVGGTAAYDPASHSVYVPDDSTVGGVASDSIDRLDIATGTLLARANVVPSTLAMGTTPEFDFLHTALTLGQNGFVYAGTSSTCDVSPWRGRVAAVDTRSMTLADTFMTTFGQGGAYSGGGVWGWGGVSIDGSGNVYAGIGNADVHVLTAPYVQAPNEHAGFSEHVVKLSSDLSTVLAANYPGFSYGGNSVDLDFAGTPVLFTPLGCNTMSASQGKAGALVLYDTATLAAGPVASLQLSESLDTSAYVGNPGYSPMTGLLYAAAATAQGGSLEPPGLVAIAANGCHSYAIAWHAQFGPDSLTYGKPRSAPTVTAGGVVLIGTPCSPTSDGTGCLATPGATIGGALWAVDASSGALLNGARPLLFMPSPIRMAPVVDGNWMYVMDAGGHLAGFTLSTM